MASASYTKNLAMPVLTGSLLPYPGPLSSLNVHVCFNTFWFQEECASIFPQQLWCLSDIFFAIF